MLAASVQRSHPAPDKSRSDQYDDDDQFYEDDEIFEFDEDLALECESRHYGDMGSLRASGPKKKNTKAKKIAQINQSTSPSASYSVSPPQNTFLSQSISPSSSGSFKERGSFSSKTPHEHGFMKHTARKDDGEAKVETITDEEFRLL